MLNTKAPMVNRIYIVDNFYPDPDGVIDLMYQQDREQESGGNYAGVMSNAAFLTPEHSQVISSLVGEPVKPGTQLCGKIRWSKEDDPYKQDIHFDVGDHLLWAGVVYLSKEHPEGIDGTVFWKHKETGLEEIPMTQEGIEQYGWKNTDDLKTFLDTDGMDHSKWTRTMSVPYRYNRLVLFRPWMFHSPGPAFGKDLKSARIVQTMFWGLVGNK